MIDNDSKTKLTNAHPKLETFFLALADSIDFEVVYTKIDPNCNVCTHASHYDTPSRGVVISHEVTDADIFDAVFAAAQRTNIGVTILDGSWVLEEQTD